MIGYLTLGTNDLDKALAFYDALFASVGVTRQPGPAHDEPCLTVGNKLNAHIN